MHAGADQAVAHIPHVFPLSFWYDLMGLLAWHWAFDCCFVGIGELCICRGALYGGSDDTTYAILSLVCNRLPPKRGVGTLFSTSMHRCPRGRAERSAQWWVAAIGGPLARGKDVGSRVDIVKGGERSK